MWEDEVLIVAPNHNSKLTWEEIANSSHGGEGEQELLAHEEDGED